jgi:hypothetical protein
MARASFELDARAKAIDPLALGQLEIGRARRSLSQTRQNDSIAPLASESLRRRSEVIS